MKDYKLSEVKAICKEQLKSGKNCFGCPLSHKLHKYYRCILEDISKFKADENDGSDKA